MEPTLLKELVVLNARELVADGVRFPCALGRGGVTGDKREGDIMTPAGRFPLRCCYYRPDRLDPAKTTLPLIPLAPTDGWCDDPAHPRYNKPVKLPFEGRHETLWRADHLYDLIIPLGYNDDPVVPGKGSAIFLHAAREDGGGTEGCVAISREALLSLLPRLSPQTVVVIPLLA